MEGEIDEIDFSDGKKRCLDANKGSNIHFFGIGIFTVSVILIKIPTSQLIVSVGRISTFLASFYSNYSP